MKSFSTKINLLLVTLFMLTNNVAQSEGMTFTNIEITPLYKSLIVADRLMMEIGGVRVIERQDNTKMLYVIASTTNKHPIHQRTVAYNKAYRDLLAYFDGREIEAKKKLDRKKTTIITDDGVSHKIVKSLDETIITCVRGKVRGLPTLGTWSSADKNIFYIAIGGIIDADGKFLHE